jgi:hypothetical protein
MAPSRLAPPPCRRLGLGKLAPEVTGFLARTLGALAHLRDAWRVADSGNAASVAASIRLLMESPLMREKRHLAVIVLMQDLEGEHKAGLAHAVGLTVEVLGRGGANG